LQCLCECGFAGIAMEERLLGFLCFAGVAMEQRLMDFKDLDDSTFPAMEGGFGVAYQFAAKTNSRQSEHNMCSGLSVGIKLATSRRSLDFRLD